jgi:hypothetical protein
VRYLDSTAEEIIHHREHRVHGGAEEEKRRVLS